jgi:Cd2+/Zn2+-exporting ATPase
MNRKQKKMLIRIIIASAALIALRFVPVVGAVRLCLYLAVYIFIGYDILYKAARGILNGRPLDENFLMAVATVGAFALALLEKSGEYVEGIAVMLLYQVGEWFQSWAVGRSRKSIGALMDIRPDHACIERDGRLERVDPSEVAAGTVITVQPGERIPIDGAVVSGESAVDTSALTGESVPRTARPGDRVISGCINLTGVLRIRTDKEYGESTVARILELVENSAANKSRSEGFISRFARIYTPAVCGSAAALAVLPPLFRLVFMHADAQWTVWIYRALTFLVISCPCALVISIPLTFFAGIGGAGREGILIKGSNYLEALASAGTVVFDKTGTLTKGVFEVTRIDAAALPEGELLELAAHAECASSHPISQSLIRACGGNIDRTRTDRIEEIGGRGVTALVDKKSVAVGNAKLMADRGIELPEGLGDAAGTVIYVAVDGSFAGRIVISDAVKPGSAEAVRELGRAGVGRIVMLTGDNRAVAERVGRELGIGEVRAELLPAGKVEAVERLITEAGKGKVVFAGDGINDAPVLARADIGVAMGALGSDAAIEAADVVLMDDDPRKIAAAVRLSRRCLRIVYENTVFTIAVKFACLVLGALGLAGMWAAVFADVGVMVIAVLNAVRALSRSR